MLTSDRVAVTVREQTKQIGVKTQLLPDKKTVDARSRSGGRVTRGGKGPV